jgi:hypothetical protein
MGQKWIKNTESRSDPMTILVRKAAYLPIFAHNFLGIFHSKAMLW